MTGSTTDETWGALGPPNRRSPFFRSPRHGRPQPLKRAWGAPDATVCSRVVLAYSRPFVSLWPEETQGVGFRAGPLLLRNLAIAPLALRRHAADLRLLVRNS